MRFLALASTMVGLLALTLYGLALYYSTSLEVLLNNL